MSLWLALSLRGACAWALVDGLDRLGAGRAPGAMRRAAWLAVAAAFLVPLHFPGPHRLETVPGAAVHAVATVERSFPAGPAATAARPLPWRAGLLILWGLGAAGFLGVAALQTRSAARRWAGERLSTDSRLLALLEDAKAEAGVTAPLGLVVSDRVPSPALLGWLRPRILLPRALAEGLPPERLRAVLLHELAHFRALDIPVNAVFLLVRALHWFNPAAHLAARSWNRFREEAADATVLRWMEGDAVYGETLLETVRRASGLPLPYGAVGVGESARHLKRRLAMIGGYGTRVLRPGWALGVLLGLGVALAVFPLPAQTAPDEKAAAVAAMKPWLQEIDAGNYGGSWDHAAKSFRDAVSREKWIALCGQVRTPLGASLGRTLGSALRQTNGKGDFVIAQFDGSFQNLKYATETVSFERERDGVWRAAGYFIKPR